MDVFVGRLMSSPVQTVSPETSVQEAAGLLIERDIGSVVVVGDDNHLEGILTSTDFVRIAADGADVAGTPVAEYMSRTVTTTTANDSIAEVAETMVERGFHHVPVVDDTEGVVGMITSTDLTAYLSELDVLAPS